ncbi:YheC/YheD family protein [Peribacillus kribbensis]|uniref:YheC/YheD family protein n=1 Tax=Peribacillus kribbensis TaxID=356658 RepID=UPI0004134BAC|nr:YheC/YheD family protein [Peribacillus kribbensis]
MSKQIRGRWRQYQKLYSIEAIRPFLLKTELFDEKTFYRNLPSHLTFKPCYGQREIIISKLDYYDEKYNIVDNSVTTTVSGKADVLDYLTGVCKEGQYYLLQDTEFLYKREGEMVELLATVQRDLNSVWQVTDILEEQGNLKNRITGFSRKKIAEIAIETAISIAGDDPACFTVLVELGLLDQHLWIKDIELHTPKSKWSQHQILSSVNELPPFLPHTELATPDTIFHFLMKYQEIMLKPCLGQWGIGIVKISWQKADSFELHHERGKLRFKGVQEMINYLEANFLSKQRYIVQERIDLAKIDDSVIDVRVMVQRNHSGNEWEITAKAVKVAFKDYVVTNAAKTIMSLEEALESSTIKSIKESSLLTMDKVCTICSDVLGKHYLNVTDIGIDIGIDNRGNFWIFETNLVPDISLFLRLEDKSVYKNVVKKWNGWVRKQSPQ